MLLGLMRNEAALGDLQLEVLFRTHKLRAERLADC